LSYPWVIHAMHYFEGVGWSSDSSSESWEKNVMLINRQGDTEMNADQVISVIIISLSTI